MFLRFRFVIVVVVGAVVVIKIQLRTVQSMRSNNGYVVPAADVIIIHYRYQCIYIYIHEMFLETFFFIDNDGKSTALTALRLPDKQGMMNAHYIFK